MIIKQENNSIFSKYILSAPNNNINNNDMNILNMSINNYVINNKSIIANLVYYIERSITK